MGEAAKKQVQNEWSEREERQTKVAKVHTKIKWSDFLKTAKECGFESGFTGTFERQSRKCQTVITQEEEAILYDKARGIILYAESVDGGFLGQATISCEVWGNFSAFNSAQRHFWEKVSFIKGGTTGTGFSLHLRQGLKETLDEIQKMFKLVPVWDTALIPNCLNYAERINCKSSRNLLKLKKCAQGVKDIMHN